MERLSSSIDGIASRYDVIVVGSGYGGAIAASRLARAGLRVCVLERGRERQPGEYPDTTLEGVEEMQFDLPGGHVGPRSAMFDFRVNQDITAVVGAGLGGTSIINAGVAIRPDARVFADERWPEALRREGGRRLEQGFELAEQMLGSTPLPDEIPLPPKLAALKRSAEHMGQPFLKPPLNITFVPGESFAGVPQPGCTLCGDCASGCNVGAKNTLLMNYLPDARRHGASFFVQAAVRRVERGADGAWRVHYQALHTGREAFDAPLLFVTADIVILAAGTLGSTEILMRSHREGGLGVSDRLGQGFSGNGDVLAFGYNAEPEIRGVGLGHGAPAGDARLPPEQAVGPCIAGIIDMRGTADWRAGMTLAEGGIPGLVGPVLPVVQKVSAEIGGFNTATDRRHEQALHEVESAVFGPHRGATARTQMYLGMCHDGSRGAMKLVGDRLRIEWPDIGRRPVIRALNDRIREATVALRGIAVNDPIWNDVFGRSLITVHPLGGCAMADSAEGGVVDHACKVFSSSAGTAVHEGLYVCDGSIIPSSLGINPLLTICALAERCCMILAEERGLHLDYAPGGPLPSPAAPAAVGIRFTESMKGWYSAGSDPGPAPEYAHAAKRGEAEGSSLQFVLTIATDDLDAMINSPAHEARMAGTVTAPRLSPDPLTVAQGTFNLFVQDPTTPDVRRMLYRMVLSAKDGHRFYLTGFKTIRRGRPVWDLWHDCTTLSITLHEGASDAGAVLGTGILTISPANFVRLLSTLDPTHTQSPGERLDAVVKFGRNFAGVLFDFYGGIAAPPSEASSPPSRKRRALRVGPPQLVVVNAGGTAGLLLTRYRGGGKGPVVLTQAGGTSSIFATDTLGTNLLEYLFAHGHDVWLCDHAAETKPGAQVDWPALVEAVLAKTGAGSVQVVAHDRDGLTVGRADRDGLHTASALPRSGHDPLLGEHAAAEVYPWVLEQLDAR